MQLNKKLVILYRFFEYNFCKQLYGSGLYLFLVWCSIPVFSDKYNAQFDNSISLGISFFLFFFVFSIYMFTKLIKLKQQQVIKNLKASFQKEQDPSCLEQIVYLRIKFSKESEKINKYYSKMFPNSGSFLYKILSSYFIVFLSVYLNYITSL